MSWISLALTLAMQTAPLPTSPVPTPQAAPDPTLDRMAALYDDICLKTFPDDKAVAKAMTARGAVEISKEGMNIYLHEDPGRGWTVPDGDSKFVVTIEAPPFHACAVRREMAAPFPNLLAYLAVTDRYKMGGPTFQNMQPMDLPNGDIRTHLEAEMRTIDGQAEALMIVTDTRPDRTVEQRFVHQYSKP